MDTVLGLTPAFILANVQNASVAAFSEINFTPKHTQSSWFCSLAITEQPCEAGNRSMDTVLRFACTRAPTRYHTFYTLLQSIRTHTTSRVAVPG
jgi:hypothetical protein